MKLKRDATGRRAINTTSMFVALALALAIAVPATRAQTQGTEPKPAEPKPAEPKREETMQIIYLNNVFEQNDLNDIQTDMRNMLPKAKIYGSASQNAISIRGTADEIQLAQKIASDLDKRRKTYRLTYTITDTDGSKRIGSQSYKLTVVSGESTVLKQGSRVPIVTAKYDVETTFQYQDVGLTINARAATYADGVRLVSKVEQSSPSDEKSGVGPQDPVFHQTVLDGSSLLEIGKPQVLGSLDVPGSTHRQEIEVVAELVK